jgi:hypothetical protein
MFSGAGLLPEKLRDVFANTRPTLFSKEVIYLLQK